MSSATFGKNATEPGGIPKFGQTVVCSRRRMQADKHREPYPLARQKRDIYILIH